jgi:hypothetical protein
MVYNYNFKRTLMGWDGTGWDRVGGDSRGTITTLPLSHTISKLLMKILSIFKNDDRRHH